MGTETLLDKSKSTKTVLMTLFKGYHDIEGIEKVIQEQRASMLATEPPMPSLTPSTGYPHLFGTAATGLSLLLTWLSMRMALQDAPEEPEQLHFLSAPTAKLFSIKKEQRLLTTLTISTNQFQVLYSFIKDSEYPTVDGKQSIDCYLKAVEECYGKLKSKSKNKNILSEMDYLCFHAPFYKMVQKAYSKLAKLEANPT